MAQRGARRAAAAAAAEPRVPPRSRGDGQGAGRRPRRAAIAAATGSPTLVDLGGDVATAGPAPAGGWVVRVTDDHRAGPDADGQSVTVSGGGLATSSTTVRRWRRAGRPVHHIVDPATGEPAAPVWRTVSVAAASCVDANTASTAAIVRGASAPQWLESLGLPARLVDPSGERRHRGRMAGGVVILAAAGPSPLWYLSRGTGAITLVLLSASVMLGITGTLRWRLGARTPRFVVDGLHRNVSLLVVVLLAAHIVTSLLDPFAHLRVLDAVVPLASRYRPLWLGFGALAFDLLVALIVTSVAARAAGPARLAGGALGRVRVLAGGRAARPGHGDRRALGVAAAADRRVRGRRRRRARGAPAARLAGAGRAATRRSRARGRLGRGRRRVRAAGPAEAGLGAPRRHAADAAGGGAVAGGHAHRQRSRRRSRCPSPPRSTAPPGRSARGRRARAGRHRGADPRRRRAAAPRPAPLWPGPPRRRPADGLQQRQARPAAAPADLYRGRVVGLRGDLVVARLTAPGARPVQLRLALRIDAGGAVVGTADAQEVA